MLALRRFSRVETPTSECRISCTRCCVCASWGALRCSGDAGVASSTGEASTPSCVGDDALFKSELKLSVPSIGGIAGGAAIAGADVVMVGNGYVVVSRSERPMPRGSVEVEMPARTSPMQRHPSRRQVLPTISTRQIKHCSTLYFCLCGFLDSLSSILSCPVSPCLAAYRMRWLPASRMPAL
jgi:hypothetical protein